MFHIPLPRHLSAPRALPPRVQLSAQEQRERALLAAISAKDRPRTHSNASNQQPAEQIEGSVEPTNSTTDSDTNASASIATNTTAKPRPEDKPPRVNDPTIRFLKVPVKPTDSVVSIAVRHGISESELRQYNRGLYIWQYCDFVNHVWVPQRVDPSSSPLSSNETTPAVDPAVAEETNRRYLTHKQFCILTGANPAEASYYLDESKFNFDAAVAAYKMDADFQADVQREHEAERARRKRQSRGSGNAEYQPLNMYEHPTMLPDPVQARAAIKAAGPARFRSASELHADLNKRS